MNRSNTANDVIEKIVGVVVLLVAFGAVAGAGYFYLKSRTTRNWPAVEGVITESGTRSQYEPGDSGAPTTIAQVRYRYAVDGIAYHNDTISLGQYGSNDASHAVKEARKYPAGRRVRVYYNPDNPHDSVLEHKTPWIFIAIFSGLGTILLFIGMGMLSGRFNTRPPAEATWRDTHTPAHGRKTPAATGIRLAIAAVLLSVLTAVLSFHFFFNENAGGRKSSGQAAESLPEGYGPQPLSTYSRVETSPPCQEGLKAQVAERQKIRLDDGIHLLYVTATLCIEEKEMEAASQTHRTWPAIAHHLATYDNADFDPESALPSAGGENTSEVFRSRLKGIEQKCLEHLHENGIFFVKAIRFEFLQIF